jgi:hypothetical protein
MINIAFNAKSVATALEFIQSLSGILESADKSLIEYTKPTRVEPTCLVDQRVAQQPYMEDVMHTALNVFAAYYLQAAAITLQVGRISVLRKLDRLNPNRTPMATIGNVYSEENRLVFPGDEMSPYSQENANAGTQSNLRLINDSANLSVGKLLEIQVSLPADPNKPDAQRTTATFPIQVRLMTGLIRPDTLTHTLSLDSRDTSFKTRWHMWRAGQLELIRDVLLCQDLIEQHRENLMNDETGYYRQKTQRRRNNFLASILDRKNPSVGAASSIIVMQSDTASELELKIRGKLRDFKTREKLFKDNLAMLMFVVNPDLETVTMYSKSIEESSIISIKEITRKAKGGQGPDILDILNALKKSNAPSF